MSNRSRKYGSYNITERNARVSHADKIAMLQLMKDVTDDMARHVYKRDIEEMRNWAIKLAGDRCECKNVFTATGVDYTQCDPCAFREWAGLQEPEASE